MQSEKKSRIHIMVRAAIVAAVTCVLAPVAVPIGPVPISLATLVLYLSVYLLDWKLASLSCLVYILLGTVGLPVFSGFTGGAAKLLGPTGGYIVGYIPMVIVSGLIIDRFPGRRWIHFLGLVLGTALLYAIGTAWFCYEAESALVPALGLCVFPFIPGDLIKIAAAMIFGPMIRSRLEKAKLA